MSGEPDLSIFKQEIRIGSAGLALAVPVCLLLTWASLRVDWSPHDVPDAWWIFAHYFIGAGSIPLTILGCGLWSGLWSCWRARREPKQRHKEATSE